METKIAHLSDLHLPLPSRIPVSALLTKRLLGWLNLRLVRSHGHQIEPSQKLITHLSASKTDQVVITGDLTNLALAAEYQQIDQLLRQWGLQPKTTLLLPGNHDRYTPQADRNGSFENGLKRWFPNGFQRDKDYPRVVETGCVRLIGLDTAVWRGPIRAAGQLDPAQLERVVDQVEQALQNNQHPVIALHHPPHKIAGRFFKNYRAGLAGRHRFHERLGHHKLTVLHGHMHRYDRVILDRMQIIGTPSISLTHHDPEQQAAYQEYTFDEQGLKTVYAYRYTTNAGEAPITKALLFQRDG